MRRAHIGLGANLGEPARQLRSALDRIAGLGTIVAVSAFYRTAPMGPGDQPDYCNAVCTIDTVLEPAALLDGLLAIERAHGRVRDGRRWGPRTLDLDLLHVEGVSTDVPALRLPHPGIGDRNFVLVPWADVAPDLVVPGVGRIGDSAVRIGRNGLSRWDGG
jgi:2-amino-4-hydroxy-6-hydroxymethyldihydropteridine diphosphokinase